MKKVTEMIDNTCAVITGLTFLTLILGIAGFIIFLVMKAVIGTNGLAVVVFTILAFAIARGSDRFIEFVDRKCPY